MSDIDDQFKKFPSRFNTQEAIGNLRVDPLVAEKASPLLLSYSKSNVSNSCNKDKIQRKYPNLDRHEDRWIQMFLQRRKRKDDLPSSTKNTRIINDSDLIVESLQRDLGLALIDEEDAKKIQEGKQVRCQKLLTSKKLEGRLTQEQISRTLFQCLVNIRIVVENDEHDRFEVGKYYLQAIELAPRIPVSDPALQFSTLLNEGLATVVGDLQ